MRSVRYSRDNKQQTTLAWSTRSAFCRGIHGDFSLRIDCQYRKKVGIKFSHATRKDALYIRTSLSSSTMLTKVCSFIVSSTLLRATVANPNLSNIIHSGMC